MKFLSGMIIWVCMTSLTLASGDPNLATYYIGYEQRPLPAMGSDGLPYAANPNHQRLTMLFAHSYVGDTYPTKIINHYHPLGAYRFTGPSTNPTQTFANARTPEGTRTPLTLQAGTGAFAGHYVSNLGSPTSTEYSALTIKSIESLRGGQAPTGTAPTTPFSYANLVPTAPTFDAAWHNYLSTASGNWLMLNSSPVNATTFTDNGGTYAGSVADVMVGMQLVNITPGLKVYSSAGVELFTGGAGTTENLGLLDADFSFTPVFATQVGPAAQPSLYDAVFRLVDLSQGKPLYGNSGEFRYAFQVAAVPEPSSLALAALPLGLVWARYRRRLSRSTGLSHSTELPGSIGL